MGESQQAHSYLFFYFISCGASSVDLVPPVSRSHGYPGHSDVLSCLRVFLVPGFKFVFFFSLVSRFVRETESENERKTKRGKERDRQMDTYIHK